MSIGLPDPAHDLILDQEPPSPLNLLPHLVNFHRKCPPSLAILADPQLRLQSDGA